MRVIKLYFLLLFAVIAYSITDHSHEDHRHKVVLRDHVIDTRSDPALPSRRIGAAERDQRYHYILHLGRKATTQTKARVEEKIGAPLDHYLPHHSYMVMTTAQIAQDLRAMDDIVWINVLEEKHKASPNAEWSQSVLAHFTEMGSANHSSIAEWAPALQRHLNDEVDIDVSSDRVAVTCMSADPSLHKRMAEWVAARNEVYYLEPHQGYTTHNKWARTVLDSGICYLPPDAVQQRRGLYAWKFGLDGRNQIVGVADTGLDLNSCFFEDSSDGVTSPMIPYTQSRPTPSPSNHRKVVQYVTYRDGEDSNGHGTHVAGSVAGNSRDGSLSEYNGIAPAAKIAFFDIGQQERVSVPSDVGPQMFSFAYDAGARIYSNSWGRRDESYTSAMQSVDRFLHDHPDFLAVFSAGNEGYSAEGSIVSPAAAKNCLSVGATVNSPFMFRNVFCSGGYEPDSRYCSLIEGDTEKYYNIDSVAPFSSTGPTYDGRIKPDIVGPGMFIYSSDRASCSSSGHNVRLRSDMGTSMAAPLVAGSIALIRQYYMEGFHPSGYRGSSKGFTPTGSLMKAVAIAGATRIDGYMDKGGKRLSYDYLSVNAPAPPNQVQGFGRFQLSTTLFFANESNFATILAGYDSATGTYSEDSLQSADDFNRYRFCVLGDGAPVKVTLVWMDPAASPNAGAALVNDLDLTAQRTAPDGSPMGTLKGNFQENADRVNTVELISVGSASFGEVWDVTVSAANMGGSGPQSYALVLTGQIAGAGADGFCSFRSRWQDVTGTLSIYQNSIKEPTSSPAGFAEFFRAHIGLSVLLFFTLFTFTAFCILRLVTCVMRRTRSKQTHPTLSEIQ